MPIYEYRCMTCGTKFEKLVLSSTQTIQCSACSSTSVEKLLSSFGFKSSGKFSGTKSSGCSSCNASHCASCH